MAFRFIIVGTGNISKTYWNAIQNLQDTEVAGFVSRHGARPAWLAGEAQVEIAGSLSDVESEFDAAILCTPNMMHAPGAIEAAGLGKHVLTEKPLAITIPSMDAMIESCRREGVKLGVAWQRRMSPDNQAVRRLLDQKRLGRIYAADVSVKNYRDDAYYKSGAYRGTWLGDGGGPFMQQASHQVDLYAWFFGMPERVISCCGRFAHAIETEDHGAAILQHPDGMIGTIIASTVAKPGFDGRIEIHSEKGSVVMENDVITFWGIDDLENPGTMPGKKIHSGASSASVEDTAGHEAIIRDFVEAVQEDREPLVSGESGRLATEIILQIYQNDRNNISAHE